MERVFFNGTECHTYGELPAVGTQAPDFDLTTPELKQVTRDSFPGKYIVLNIFPSLDTSVCATSVRKFNKEVEKLDDAVVLAVSMDLPFAAARFCANEGIKNVTAASAFRDPGFIKQYGVGLIDGPLKGLLTRAVVIIDPQGKIVYRQLVEEITNEPDYKAALSVLKQH